MTFTGGTIAVGGTATTTLTWTTVGTLTGTEIMTAITGGAVTAHMVGNSGEYLDWAQKVAREFDRNLVFKKWFHRVYKVKYKITGGGRHNPNMHIDDVIEAYEMWLKYGRPRA